MKSYSSVMLEILKKDIKVHAFTKKSLDRYQQTKMQYNKELKKYYDVIADANNIDLEELNKTFKTLSELIKDIGIYNHKELQEGFNIQECKSIIIDVNNIDVAVAQIEDVTNDFWECKMLYIYKKSNVVVGIFERPYFYKYAKVEIV